MLVQDSSQQVFTIPFNTLGFKSDPPLPYFGNKKAKALNPLESLLQLTKQRQAVSEKKTTKQIMAAPLPRFLKYISVKCSKSSYMNVVREK